MIPKVICAIILVLLQVSSALSSESCLGLFKLARTQKSLDAPINNQNDKSKNDNSENESALYNDYEGWIRTSSREEVTESFQDLLEYMKDEFSTFLYDKEYNKKLEYNNKSREKRKSIVKSKEHPLLTAAKIGLLATHKNYLETPDPNFSYDFYILMGIRDAVVLKLRALNDKFQKSNPEVVAALFNNRSKKQLKQVQNISKNPVKKTVLGIQKIHVDELDKLSIDSEKFEPALKAYKHNIGYLVRDAMVLAGDGRNFPIDLYAELFGAAMVGLNQALTRHDEQLGPFWPYAKKRVWGNMIDYLRDFGIHSRSSLDIRRRLMSAIASLRGQKERDVTDEEILEHLARLDAELAENNGEPVWDKATVARVEDTEFQSMDELFSSLYNEVNSQSMRKQRDKREAFNIHSIEELHKAMTLIQQVSLDAPYGTDKEGNDVGTLHGLVHGHLPNPYQILLAKQRANYLYDAFGKLGIRRRVAVELNEIAGLTNQQIARYFLFRDFSNSKTKNRESNITQYYKAGMSQLRSFLGSKLK